MACGCQGWRWRAGTKKQAAPVARRRLHRYKYGSLFNLWSAPATRGYSSFTFRTMMIRLSTLCTLRSPPVLLQSTSQQFRACSGAGDWMLGVQPPVVAFSTRSHYASNRKLTIKQQSYCRADLSEDDLRHFLLRSVLSQREKLHHKTTRLRKYHI